MMSGDRPNTFQEATRSASQSAASVPEPAPVPSGDLVTPALMAWLAWAGDGGSVRAIVRARDEYGAAKYGCRLTTHDGRDKVEDLRQEVGDALQYAMAAVMRCDPIPGDVWVAAKYLVMLIEGRRV